jgi:predicted glycoside hydrolase/deacetylase ChbG (UPF0249 family)
VSEPRYLLVTADDFGIGPETSAGILDLAARGAVTSTVLLVNSPFAVEAVAMWRRTGAALEVGWHPCLTLDRPVLDPARVPSLVDGAGRFHPLSEFLRRVWRDRLDPSELRSELAAQLRRFVELTGRLPANVNAHHHVHVFAPVASALRAVLAGVTPTPYLRRVVEPWRTLAWVPGARIKRWYLSRVGRRVSQDRFPTADWLVGITDPHRVRHPAFFHRWLAAVPGRFVELTCHPGFLDATLVGRDGTFADGRLHRRQRELELLRAPGFARAVADAGFTPVTAAAMAALRTGDPPARVRRAG